MDEFNWCAISHNAKIINRGRCSHDRYVLIDVNKYNTMPVPEAMGRTYSISSLVCSHLHLHRETGRKVPLTWNHQKSHLSHHHPQEDKVMEYEGLKIVLNGLRAVDRNVKHVPTSLCVPHQEDDGSGNNSHVPGLPQAM